MNDWVAAIGKQKKFMGGDEPNLADLVRPVDPLFFLLNACVLWVGSWT